MRNFSFVACSLLALSGGALAIGAVVEESFKGFAIGFVLLLTAGVFALLYLGTRD